MWNADVHHMFTNPLRNTFPRNNLDGLDNSSTTCGVGTSKKVTCLAWPEKLWRRVWTVLLLLEVGGRRGEEGCWRVNSELSTQTTTSRCCKSRRQPVVIALLRPLRTPIVWARKTTQLQPQRELANNDTEERCQPQEIACVRLIRQDRGEVRLCSACWSTQWHKRGWS